MRTTLLSIIMAFWFSGSIGSNADLTPVFDERIELMGAIYRLAEANEYTNNRIPEFAMAADEYFQPYSDHAAVVMARELRATHSISFDAVIRFAMSLNIEGGQVTLDKEILGLNNDGRWTLPAAQEFTQKVNSFYHQADFPEFFASYRPLQQHAIESFSQSMMQYINLGWFNDFYGEMPQGSFGIILGMFHQGGYGPGLKLPDGTEQIYAIMSINAQDTTGIPTFGQMDLQTLIHEFNHPFCNPLVDDIYPEIQNAVLPAFHLAEEMMKAQNYGQPEIMMKEMLVRTAELRYYKSSGLDSAQVNGYIAGQKQRGFFWIQHVNDLLQHYENNRDTYPTLRTFMPEIVRWHNSEEFARVTREYSIETELWPYIVSTSVANGATDVDPSETSLVITFSKPMNTGMYSLIPGSLGVEGIPGINGAQWDEEQTTWTLSISLEPGKDYSMVFPSTRFRCAGGDYMLKETLNLSFSTTSAF